MPTTHRAAMCDGVHLATDDATRPSRIVPPLLAV